MVQSDGVLQPLKSKKLAAANRQALFVFLEPFGLFRRRTVVSRVFKVRFGSLHWATSIVTHGGRSQYHSRSGTKNGANQVQDANLSESHQVREPAGRSSKTVTTWLAQSLSSLLPHPPWASMESRDRNIM